MSMTESVADLFANGPLWAIWSFCLIAAMVLTGPILIALGAFLEHPTQRRHTRRTR